MSDWLQFIRLAIGHFRFYPLPGVCAILAFGHNMKRIGRPNFDVFCTANDNARPLK